MFVFFAVSADFRVGRGPMPSLIEVNVTGANVTFEMFAKINFLFQIINHRYGCVLVILAKF